LSIVCNINGTALVYTYTYDVGARDQAEEAALLQDPVYRVQFRTDKDTFPELTAIYLEIKLSDGTTVFSQKYDQRVTFGFDRE
jgi:hypothetical protein